MSDINQIGLPQEQEDLLGEPADIITDQNFETVSKNPKGPDDISKHVDDGPVQPELKELVCFPKTNGRKFNPSWYKTYNWIEYSLSKDKVYCFVCRHFSTAAQSEQSKAFLSEGFGLWTKCTGDSERNNKLLKHKDCHFHVSNVYKYKSYLESKSSQKMVIDHIGVGHLALVKKKRICKNISRYTQTDSRSEHSSAGSSGKCLGVF